MVDDGSFVLPFLPTPQAMGYHIETMELLGWWILVKPMTLGDSEGDTGWKNFKPLGKVLRA